MRKAFIFGFIFLAYISLAKNASAQYRSVFGKDSTTWIVKSSCFISAHILSSVKDTMLHGLKYKVIEGEEGAGSDMYRYHIYYLREDTVAGKLWARDELEDIETEYLLMDLRLNKGDNFEIYPNEFMIVDSVYFMTDGRKVINFNKSNGCGLSKPPFYFLEGTGPCSGLANFGQGILTCHYKDTLKIFSDLKYKNCGLQVVSVDERITEFNSFRISPNPINNYGIVSFENDAGCNVIFSIYDVSGKCLYQTQCKENRFSFSMENYKPGIYLYKLTNQNNKQANGKLIKN